MQRAATEWPIHSFTPCAASLIPCNPTHVILCNPVPSVIRFSDSGTAAFDKAEATGGSAAIEDAAVADADAGLSSFVSEAVSESARPDLSRAVKRLRRKRSEVDHRRGRCGAAGQGNQQRHHQTMGSVDHGVASPLAVARRLPSEPARQSHGI